MTPVKRLRPDASVNLVPMIDVVFQLVVFFMVSTTFTLQPALELVLPESQTAEPTPMTQLVITIVDAQTIYLNQEAHTLASLDVRMTAYEGGATTQSVQVQGQANISYQLLIQVFDVLRKHGFHNINLQVKQEPRP